MFRAGSTEICQLSLEYFLKIKKHYLNFIKFYFKRAKYHKLKYGTELNQEDLKPPSLEKKEGTSSLLSSADSDFSACLVILSHFVIICLKYFKSCK